MAKKPVIEVPEKPRKARITLECSPEIRKAIRIRAAQEDKSMNDFILSIVIKSLEGKKVS
jgi:uncharacterized protein (DUF1778 family)